MARRALSPLSLCLFLDYAGISLRQDHEGRGAEHHAHVEPTTASTPVAEPDALDDVGDESGDVAPGELAVDEVAADEGEDEQADAAEPSGNDGEIRRLRPNGVSNARVDPDAGLGIVAARARRAADLAANFSMVRRMVVTSVLKMGLNVDVDEVMQDLALRYIERGKVWDPTKATFKTLMQWAMKAQFRNAARRYLAEKKLIDHGTTERMIANADAMDKEFSVGDLPMKGSSSASSMISPMSESSRAAAYAGENGAIERISARRKLETLAHVAKNSVSLTTMLSQHHPDYKPDEGVSAANARQRRAINHTGQTIAAMAMAATDRGVMEPKIRDPYIIVPMSRALDTAPALVDEAAVETAPTAAINIHHLTETGEGAGGKTSKRRVKGEREPARDVDVQRPSFAVPLIDADATSDDDAKWRATALPLDMPPVVKLRSPLRRRSAGTEQP